MAVSTTFDDEGIGQQGSLWTTWYLTPRVFEKEAKDKAVLEAKSLKRARPLQDIEAKPLRKAVQAEQVVVPEIDMGLNVRKGSSFLLPLSFRTKEIVVAHWDPDLYRSKIWPAICLFGASFGALHLISWNMVFPTFVELWLWRAAAVTSIVSMLIFMHFEKVVFRLGGPLTIISLVSPALYLLSRIVMVGGVIAAFRASDPAVYDTYVVSTYWAHVL